MGITDYINEHRVLFIFILISLLSVIFYFAFWKRADSYTKRNFKKFFSGTKLTLVIFFSSFFLLRWAYPNATTKIHLTTFWFPMIGAVCLIIVLEISQLRYQTRQIIAPNFHGCFATYDEINGFIIFPIGSVIIFDIILWTNKVLVARKETVSNLGELGGAVTIARVSPISEYELDDDVKRFIEKTKHYPSKNLSGKLFYGFFDDIQELDWTEEQLKLLEQEATLETKEQKQELYEKLEKNDLIERLIDLKEILKKETNLYLMLKKELNIDNPSIIDLYKMYKNACMSKSKLKEEFHSTVEVSEEGAEHRKIMESAYKQEPEKTEVYEEGAI